MERQFNKLRADDFAPLTIIDDVHGRSVDDAILKVEANPLEVVPDVCAYRLGGKEFAPFSARRQC